MLWLLESKTYNCNVDMEKQFLGAFNGTYPNPRGGFWVAAPECGRPGVTADCPDSSMTLVKEDDLI